VTLAYLTDPYRHHIKIRCSICDTEPKLMADKQFSFSLRMKTWRSSTSCTKWREMEQLLLLFLSFRKHGDVRSKKSSSFRLGWLYLCSYVQLLPSSDQFYVSENSEQWSLHFFFGRSCLLEPSLSNTRKRARH
jgi:hypothetical protein